MTALTSAACQPVASAGSALCRQGEWGGYMCCLCPWRAVVATVGRHPPRCLLSPPGRLPSSLSVRRTPVRDNDDCSLCALHHRAISRRRLRGPYRATPIGQIKCYLGGQERAGGSRPDPSLPSLSPVRWPGRSPLLCFSEAHHWGPPHRLSVSGLPAQQSVRQKKETGACDMQGKKMLMSVRRSARRSTAPECVRAFVREVFPKGGEEKREGHHE